MAKTKKPVIPFQQVLDLLLDMDKPFPPVHFRRFSDLSGNSLAQFKETWPKVNPDRRFAIVEDLEELVESDTLVSFDELAEIGLADSDPRVRATSMRILWENEDSRLAPIFLNMMEKDADDVVRASAAAALGLFVYLGELEKISPLLLKKVEDRLLLVHKGTELALVRRRALESLGYSSREEVAPLLKAALKSNDTEWKASALFAMGRSANEQWEPTILQKLDDSDVEVQLEAVRAAGQLEMHSAREPLLKRLEQAETLDEDVRMATIWSLSQIGGEEVRSVLEHLQEETEDEDEADYIELAIDNLALVQDIPGFGMFDPFAGLDLEGHARIVDLSEQESDDDEDEEEDLKGGDQNQVG
jgi:HEAT repeat protein